MLLRCSFVPHYIMMQRDPGRVLNLPLQTKGDTIAAFGFLTQTCEREKREDLEFLSGKTIRLRTGA